MTTDNNMCNMPMTYDDLTLYLLLNVRTDNGTPKQEEIVARLSDYAKWIPTTINFQLCTIKTGDSKWSIVQRKGKVEHHSTDQIESLKVRDVVPMF